MASATHRTIQIVELLEQILLHADYNDVIHALRVSKHFNATILSSKSLRQKLWLDPANDSDEVCKRSQSRAVVQTDLEHSGYAIQL